MRVLVNAIAILMVLVTQTVRADSGRRLNRKLYAVPRAGAVVIDGKLDDWDWSGHIETYERGESRAVQRAEFAVMYDAGALYLAAKVKDASPMMNRHNPASDADKAWMGDCCQFRLVADRRLPFPYLASEFAKDKQADQSLHMMLWHYTDNKEPALQIHKSYAFRPVRDAWAPHGVAPRDQFQAAYRADDDGKGYCFEYRIPWETLGAKGSHPVAGDVVSTTVQFLWGDTGGLVNKACAYDVMSGPGFAFQESSCWGKLNRGKLQNVSVFSKEGKYLRSIGKAGGRPLPGAFDPSGMRDPGGIAVDGQGKLWVPETALNMKRISVWDVNTGALLKKFPNRVEG